MEFDWIKLIEVGGLAAFVVAILATILVTIIMAILRNSSKNTEKLLKQQQEILNSHQEERKEWINVTDKRQEQTNVVLEKLTSVIHDINTNKPDRM